MKNQILVTDLVRYYRLNQLVGSVLPFSSATVWRKVKNGTFPQPIKLSAGITAWKGSDIAAWLEAQPKGGEK